MEQINVTPTHVRAGDDILDFRYENDFITSSTYLSRDTVDVNGSSATVFTMITARDTSLVISVSDEDYGHLDLPDGTIWYPYYQDMMFNVDFLLQDAMNNLLTAMVYTLGDYPTGYDSFQINNGVGQLHYYVDSGQTDFNIKYQFLRDLTTDPVLTGSISNLLHVQVGGLQFDFSETPTSAYTEEIQVIKCAITTLDGFPLPNYPVTITIDGVDFSATTDEDGIMTKRAAYSTAHLESITVTVGEETSDIYYVNVISCTTLNLNLNSSSTLLSVGSNATLNASLICDANRPLPRRTIYFFESYTPTSITLESDKSILVDGTSTTLTSKVKDEDNSLISDETVYFFKEYDSATLELTSDTNTLIGGEVATLTAFLEDENGDKLEGETITLYADLDRITYALQGTDVITSWTNATNYTEDGVFSSHGSYLTQGWSNESLWSLSFDYMYSYFKYIGLMPICSAEINPFTDAKRADYAITTWELSFPPTGLGFTSWTSAPESYEINSQTSEWNHVEINKTSSTTLEIILNDTYTWIGEFPNLENLTELHIGSRENPASRHSGGNILYKNIVIEYVEE